MNSTLNISHQRAMEDLMQAERTMRKKSEETIRAMRQVLVEIANRFDGTRLETLRRDDPSIPANWGALDWKKFFNEVSVPSAGWVNAVPLDMPALRELQRQISALQTALKKAELDLKDERTKMPAVVVSSPAQIARPVVNIEQPLAAADAIENIPSGTTPALTVIIEDTKRIFTTFPSKIPAALSNVLDGGGRTGGDLARVFQRYWLILYLIGNWRLTASMELEEALANTVGVSAGSGSMRRVMLDLEEAKVLVFEILDLKSPRTSLKLYRFSAEGEALYQALFQRRPYENDWSRLIRLHEGARFPQHTLAVLAFTMHARKRGWATQILPEVTETKSVPDAWIMCAAEQLYIEVELGEKEHVSKWRNQAALNGGRIALCAATQKSRARLTADCKLEHLAGLATDLETLITGKFKHINSASPLWLTSWG